MYVPFNELPPNARLWIYQANRVFTAAETQNLEEEIKEFVSQWAAHGKQLKASGTVLHSRFVVLAADESAEAPSGCSIDSSVQFIRTLESRYQVSLFDRTKLLFETGGEVFTLGLAELKQAVSAGRLKPETRYFDNNLHQVSELQNNWIKPAAQSWLGKYF